MPDDDDNEDEKRGTAGEALGIPPAVGGARRDRHRNAEGRPAGKEAELRRQLELLEETLEQTRKEASDARDAYLRTAAEMENVRRRHRQDQADRLQYGNAELIAKLLPVVDNFHRALEHAPAGDQQLVDGLLMILRQFEDVLASEGVTHIEAVGKPFDPSEHQAVVAEPSEEHEDGTVIDELQKGYRLHDRVLRPSMVKVARNG